MKIYEDYDNHAKHIYQSKSTAWDFTKKTINELNIKDRIKLNKHNHQESLYIAYFEKLFFFETWKYFYSKKIIIEDNIVLYVTLKKFLKKFD